MFEGLKARRARALWEVEQIESQRKVLRVLEGALHEAYDPRDKLKDPDEDRWQKIGGSSDLKALDSADHGTMRTQAVNFFYRNPHARGIVRLFEKYIAGRGFNISPKAKLRRVADYWKAFWRKNGMDRRRREIVRRTVRDGEVFLRYFKDKDGVPIVRFMNPDLVAEPDATTAKNAGAVGNVSCGVETDNDDVETVLAYWYKGKRIPAEEVQHEKILVDSDVKRGRSILEIDMPDFTYYRSWLQNRMTLAKLRTAIGLVKNVDGTPTQVANIASATKTASKVNPDGSYMQKLMDGVNILTASRGVKYEFLTPNLQASDAQNDGRSVLLSISAGVGLPEFMVTADASNANYASTLVAESPGVMEFYDWQDFFRGAFERMYERVIKYGMTIGEIPEYEIVQETIPVGSMLTSLEAREAARMAVKRLREAAEADGEPAVDEPLDGEPTTVETRRPVSTECDVTFPEITHHDVKTESEALHIQKANDWVSDETARTKLGYDNETEKQRIQQEREEMDLTTGEEGQGDEDLLKSREAEKQMNTDLEGEEQ
ncbi:MAG: phage portal protein [bacterium]